MSCQVLPAAAQVGCWAWTERHQPLLLHYSMKACTVFFWSREAGSMCSPQHCCQEGHAFGGVCWFMRVVVVWCWPVCRCVLCVPGLVCTLQRLSVCCTHFCCVGVPVSKSWCEPGQTAGHLLHCRAATSQCCRSSTCTPCMHATQPPNTGLLVNTAAGLRPLRVPGGVQRPRQPISRVSRPAAWAGSATTTCPRCCCCPAASSSTDSVPAGTQGVIASCSAAAATRRCSRGSCVVALAIWDCTALMWL